MKKPVFEYCRECMFLKGKSTCDLLKDSRCEEGCVFHSTQEQAFEREQRSYARLNTLSETYQSAIADKYYGGKMPWTV